jgi:hypothetical protein
LRSNFVFIAIILSSDIILLMGLLESSPGSLEPYYLRPKPKIAAAAAKVVSDGFTSTGREDVCGIVGERFTMVLKLCVGVGYSIMLIVV